MKTKMSKILLLLTLSGLIFSCKIKDDINPVKSKISLGLKSRENISIPTGCYDYRFYYLEEGKGTISIEYCDGTSEILKLDSSRAIEVQNVKKYDLHSELGVINNVVIQPHN